MARGVRNTTLQKKANTWAKRLRLSDWDITCRYATKADMNTIDPDDNEPCFDDDTIGRMQECSIPEKVAVVLIRRNYYDHNGYKVSWNLDTLIIHELIHIIEKIGKKNAGIVNSVDKRRDFMEFEEFNCDCFSAILYYLYYDKI